MRHWRLAAAVLVLAWAAPAWAHHPFGGETPSTVWTGFLSGLGHPVIGLDHLVCVLALGLVAARLRWGLVLPIGFVLAGLLGTTLNLRAIDVSGVELAIALSIIGFGIVLSRPHVSGLGALTLISAIAGLFHGYAYAEAIIGAEMTPLLAYGAGLATIQIAIATGTLLLSRRLWPQPSLSYRFAGFSVVGAGVVFMSGLWL